MERIKTSTSTGPDQLPGFLLKKLAEYLAPNVAQLFNWSISCGSVHHMWKPANVSAIWKGKGSKEEATNYRPISVLPILARILEKLLLVNFSGFATCMTTFPGNSLASEPIPAVNLHWFQQWITGPRLWMMPWLFCWCNSGPSCQSLWQCTSHTTYSRTYAHWALKQFPSMVCFILDQS